MTDPVERANGSPIGGMPARALSLSWPGLGVPGGSDVSWIELRGEPAGAPGADAEPSLEPDGDDLRRSAASLGRAICLGSCGAERGVATSLLWAWGGGPQASAPLAPDSDDRAGVWLDEESGGGGLRAAVAEYATAGLARPSLPRPLPAFRSSVILAASGIWSRIEVEAQGDGSAESIPRAAPLAGAPRIDPAVEARLERAPAPAGGVARWTLTLTLAGDASATAHVHGLGAGLAPLRRVDLFPEKPRQTLTLTASYLSPEGELILQTDERIANRRWRRLRAPAADARGGA